MSFPLKQLPISGLLTSRGSGFQNWITAHYRYSAVGTRTSDWNLPLWEPSQNGLLLLKPQRHREKDGFVVYTFPAPSNNSTSPVILSEPLSFTLICTFDILFTLPRKCIYIESNWNNMKMQSKTISKMRAVHLKHMLLSSM